MKLVRYSFVLGMVVQVLASLARDRATYRPGVLRESWRRFRRQPIVSRAVWEQLKEYERRGFHPDDRNTRELIETWREQLFGPDGQMRYALSGASRSA